MKRLIPLFALFFFTSGACAGTIYLRSRTIDTREQAEYAAAGAKSAAGPGYYLVQFKGPVTEDDKKSLTAAGAEIIDYVPDFAFIIKLRHRDAAALKRLAGVEWVGPYRSDYKLNETLADPKRQAQFTVKLFPGANPDAVIGRAKMLGAKKIGCAAERRGGLCRVLANRSQLGELANSGSVMWIEPYIQPKLCNNVAAGICGATDTHHDLGLYGAGQIVGVADAGLDTGNTGTISADFAGRIEQAYALRRPGDWSDLNGHGTHVCGSLLGSGALSGSSPATHSYDGSFAGFAPEARLVFQSIGDSGEFVFPPLHLAELFQPAYDDGARVHNNSWGSAAAGQYTVYSNELDQFLWDHKDFTTVFSVGNDSEDLDHNGIVDLDKIYAPATAKNCIAVGATENYRTSGGQQIGYGVAWPLSYPAAPIKYDLMSNNSNGMAAFSGRGPTDDGRTKPDIVAPGTNIVSCRSQYAGYITGWGIYDSHYMYWGGTSMSTPLVAGAAALVREYYQKEKDVTPSGALVKATLINGATDISPGQYGSGSVREVYPAPDNSQGWGRLNLKDSIDPSPPTVTEFIDVSASLTTGAYNEYQYTVTDTSVPLKFTLVWTDYPGAVLAAKELVNDIDLTVTSPSGTVYPNGGLCDHTNNVEQVRIAVPEPGIYKARVTGYNIPMGPQDYALVVSGGLPATYISGSVTSSSGAPVQGALITFVWASGIKRITTNSSGTYISRVGPGTYSVQIGKPGWTFTPRARMVHVTDSPVENVDFVGTGSPGYVSGTIGSAIGGVVSEIVETPHPYLNDWDQTYTVTAHEGATRVRVHFAEIDLMDDGDTIYVTNENDVTLNTFTAKGEDVWSGWATGRVIKIRIVTNDFGNIGYGFYIDGYETDLIDQGGLSGAAITLSPGGYQTTSGQGGIYSFSSVPPGTYTITPGKAHWTFQPTARTIEIPAGGAASGVDFLGFPPGSITGEIHVAQSAAHNINVESEHPYPHNYEETWTVNGDPSATRIRLHFSRISTEPAFDLLFILDGDDNIVEIYTAEESDLWTPWIEGHTAKITLSTDDGNTEWGFKCDKYEVESLSSPLPGVMLQLSPDNRSTTTGEQGTFSFADVDVGPHTVLPYLPPWSFDPASSLVSISAGIERHLFFYASSAGINKVAYAKLFADGETVNLQNVTVTAVFNGFFYVQDATRTGGLRITSGAVVHEGGIVDISGTMEIVNGERRINATSVHVN